MPRYKVWSADRTKRFFVVTASLEDLKTKACQKLKVQCGECEIVDETDGTTVDDDEVLQEMVDSVLLLIPDGEQWTPPSTEPVQVKVLKSTAKTVVALPPLKKCQSSESGTSLGGSSLQHDPRSIDADTVSLKSTNSLPGSCSEYGDISPANDCSDLDSVVDVKSAAESSSTSSIFVDDAEQRRQSIALGHVDSFPDTASLNPDGRDSFEIHARVFVPTSLATCSTSTISGSVADTSFHSEDEKSLYFDVSSDKNSPKCSFYANPDLEELINHQLSQSVLLDQNTNYSDSVGQPGSRGQVLQTVCSNNINDNTTQQETHLMGGSINPPYQSLATVTSPGNIPQKPQIQDSTMDKTVNYAVNSSPRPSVSERVGPPPPVVVRKSKLAKMKKEKFNTVMGSLPPMISQIEYYIIRAIIPKPEFKTGDLCGFVGKVMPYLIQRIKMRGCWVLHQNQLAGLLLSACSNMPPAPKTKSPFLARIFGKSVADPASQDTPSTPISRLDCLTGLFNSVDEIVAHDLLMVMSQFPIALPLVLRAADAVHYRLMTSLLRGITVKWEPSSIKGKIIEHSLFNHPFRLVVAVRLGDNKVGKSSILNRALSKPNTFSSKQDPGANLGKPVSLDGSVEFIWLTQETCSEELWADFHQFYSKGQNQVALLANLHGNGNDYPEIVSTLLSQFSCHFLIFFMPNSSQDDWDKFHSHGMTADDTHVICVDPPDYCETVYVESSELTNPTTLSKIRQSLMESFYCCSMKSSVVVSSSIKTDTLVSAPLITTKESQSVIEFAKRYSCFAVRQAMELQMKRPKTTEETKQILARNQRLREIVSMLTSVFLLPEAILQRAVIHLETELSYVSNAESQAARDAVKVAKFDEKDQKLAAVEYCNLGLEHLVREISRAYEYYVLSNIKHNIHSIPDHIAQLFLEGHALELFDGDASNILMTWFNAVCMSVSKQRPNLRVYVISIIGLQSSGKSTLLNSLFACRFAVSVGRCSRGLFMRLLFLDKELTKKLNCDAFLVIDSEGLGSQEKSTNMNAVEKDRMLAAFAMGVSNLTVINVLGEYMNDLTDILQIAIVAMGRLEQADLSPDILMVQHLQIVHADRLEESRRAFIKAIDAVVALVKEKKTAEAAGIVNAKCIRVINERLKTDNTFRSLFHAYKDGSTANSPPSQVYHDDVVELYNKILSSCQSSSTILKFTKWRSLVENYWNSVKGDNFALRFKNIQEMCDFMERDKEIEAIKRAINAAFAHHASIIEQWLREKVSDESHESNLEEKLSRDLEESLSRVLSQCKEMKCACQEAIKKQEELFEKAKEQPWEQDVISTITKFTDRVAKSQYDKLIRIIRENIAIRGFSVTFDEKITSRIKKILGGQEPGKHDENQRRRIADEIIAEMKRFAVTRDKDRPVMVRIEDEVVDVYRDIPNMVKIIRQPQSTFDTILHASSSAFPQEIGRRDKLDRLKSLLAVLPNATKGDRYEYGMVHSLRSNVVDILKANRRLITPDVEIAIHVLVLQLFSIRMEQLQMAWDEKNTASAFFRRMEASYRQTIVIRLTYGFTLLSEGNEIIRNLFDAIGKQTVSKEHKERTQAVLDCSTEKIRLTFFTELVREVMAGTKERAVRYFASPEKELRKWFNTKVDRDFRNHKNGLSDKFELEYQDAFSKVETAVNIEKLLANTKNYMARAEIYYNENIQPSNVTPDEFIKLKDSMMTLMRNNKEAQSSIDRSDKLIPLPSENDKIKFEAYLGCMHRCPWCGVLCWRHYGHDYSNDVAVVNDDVDVDDVAVGIDTDSFDDGGEDLDDDENGEGEDDEDTGGNTVTTETMKPSKCESKKHYAPHQPTGLTGVHICNTTPPRLNTLTSVSCNQKKKNEIVRFGEFRETGITWKEATSKHLDVWSFGPHYIPQIDKLNRWFFQKLHSDIAKHRGLLPARKINLKRYGCWKLNGSAILARLEQELK